MGGVAEDRRERVPDRAVGDGRLPVHACLPDEHQDRERDDDRRDAERHHHQPPAERGDHRRPDDCHDDGPDIAAADVGADREATPVLGELLGQQPVADRMLRRD